MKIIRSIVFVLLVLVTSSITVLNFTSCTKLDPAPSCPTGKYCPFGTQWWGGGSQCYEDRTECEKENGNECRDCGV